ncbi:AAA family ATPase [Nonomuraea dietziae]|uniref:AAA family ATPase n=1 Tax=Nonomuraea dietziae TaxID=65515 RepID=UPI00340301E9
MFTAIAFFSFDLDSQSRRITRWPSSFHDATPATSETSYTTSVDATTAFWRRTTRDRDKVLIESHGCRWELIYLKASPETLRQWSAARNKLHGANSVTVSEDLLNRYLAGFKEPVDEGELTILQDRYDQPRDVHRSS